MHASLDFETFSAAGFAWDAERCRWCALEGVKATGLPAVGVVNYVEHPSFRVLSLAYDLKDGQGVRLWLPEPYAPPAELLGHIASGRPVGGWNSGGFELEVWNRYCVRRWGWPELKIEQLHDVQAKAAHWGYPRSLDNAGAILLPPELRKDPKGKSLIRKLTVPRSPTIKNSALIWTPETAPQDFADFYAYNKQDVVAEDALSARIPDLPPRERVIWGVDNAINRRGMYIDRQAVADCISIVEQAWAKYNGELRSITNGAVENSTEVAALLKWLQAQGVYLPSLDEDVITEQLNLAHSPAVLRVLRIRQMLAYGSVRKLFAIRVKTCADSRLRHQYAYAGAHTHLWNGHDVQVSNLYKSAFEKPQEVEACLAVIASRRLEAVEAACGDALEAVANCLRSVICAAPGHELYNADFTAIQAVVNAALSGQKSLLDVFHTHGKVYEFTASQITGKPLEFYLDHRTQTGAHHPDRQPYGKIAFLSSGFGGWIAAWKNFGADEYMTDPEIKQAILRWRAANPWIVEFWGGQTRYKFKDNEAPQLYGLEGAAISAVLNPGECYAYRGVRFQVLSGDLYLQPPTECSPMVYHSPELERAMGEYARPWELRLTYKGWNNNPAKGAMGWVKMNLYGGVLCQNVVAKTSREYLADALVRCEQSHLYLPVLHTHDELLTEVPIDRGNKDEFLGLINQPRPGCVDDWGRPWPVKAPAAEITHRYGKWG